MRVLTSGDEGSSCRSRPEFTVVSLSVCLFFVGGVVEEEGAEEWKNNKSTI